jgi:hypothetical protein
MSIRHLNHKIRKESKMSNKQTQPEISPGEVLGKLGEQLTQYKQQKSQMTANYASSYISAALEIFKVVAKSQAGTPDELADRAFALVEAFRIKSREMETVYRNDANVPADLEEAIRITQENYDQVTTLLSNDLNSVNTENTNVVDINESLRVKNPTPTDTEVI